MSSYSNLFWFDNFKQLSLNYITKKKIKLIQSFLAYPLQSISTFKTLNI